MFYLSSPSMFLATSRKFSGIFFFCYTCLYQINKNEFKAQSNKRANKCMYNVCRKEIAVNLHIILARVEHL